MGEKIVMGTRGSDLALAQARLVEQAFRAQSSGLEIETKIIKTRGDQPKGEAVAVVDVKAGRKGLFTGEIERALLASEIDLAVHSAKDLPSTMADGAEIGGVLARAAVDDVLVAPVPHSLESLPMDGIVATGSVRRKHQLRWKRSDLEIVDLRGNVPTRLRKLATGQFHAIILARAGLDRLPGVRDGDQYRYEGNSFSLTPLPQDVFLPAGGQGIIAVQIRRDDKRIERWVEAINHPETRLCLRAEREFLRLLNGDCNQPVGVLAQIQGEMMTVCAQVFDPEAVTPREARVEGARHDAEELAEKLFEALE